MKGESNRLSLVVALAAVCSLAQADANIVSTAYWNAHDIAKVSGIKVTNGIASSPNVTIGHKLEQGLANPGHPSDVSGLSNVQRVQRVFPQSKWDEWTSGANALYTYDSFLRAVGKYPAFCGLSNSPRGLSEDDTCKRELAALFAHMYEDSNNMTLAAAAGCSGAASYCERGPLALNSLTSYQAFSASFFDGKNREGELENDPDRVATDSYVSMASAIWRFVTPAPNGPSAQGIMAGFFSPNAGDD